MEYVIIPLLGVPAVFCVYFILKERHDFWKSVVDYMTVSAFTAVILIFTWGSVFGWDLVKTSYQDHAALVAANRRLKEEVTNLQNRPPEVRNVPVRIESNLITAEDIAYIFDLSIHLKQMIRSTKIVVSATPDSQESEKFANATVALIWDACYREGGTVLYPGHERSDCEATLANPYTVGKSDYRVSTHPPEKGIIVHSESDWTASMVQGILSKLFSDVVWKQDMPKQMKEYIPHEGYKNFAWIEFGRRVAVHEYSCGGSASESSAPCIFMLGLDKLVNQRGAGGALP